MFEVFSPGTTHVWWGLNFSSQTRGKISLAIIEMDMIYVGLTSLLSVWFSEIILSKNQIR